MGKIGWNGHLQAVIVPTMVTAFGVFLMRQFISEAVPDELLDAGRVDGCHTFQLYWHVVLPAIRPAAAVLGMLTFMQAWNDFFWPFVVLGPDNPTVQVAIATLQGGYYQDYTLVLAGTALGTLPILVGRAPPTAGRSTRAACWTCWCGCTARTRRSRWR